jgi:hypothetical protein
MAQAFCSWDGKLLIALVVKYFNRVSGSLSTPTIIRLSGHLIASSVMNMTNLSTMPQSPTMTPITKKFWYMAKAEEIFLTLVTTRIYLLSKLNPVLLTRGMLTILSKRNPII